MPIGLLFWFLMIIWLLFGLFISWPTGGDGSWRHYAPVGGNLLQFVLFFLLGWRAFGFIIRDSAPPAAKQ